jgi:hypothetical protein
VIRLAPLVLPITLALSPLGFSQTSSSQASSQNSSSQASAEPVFAGSGTVAELAHAIREAGLDANECYRVRDFRFQKEDIRVYLTDGYLIFSRPVAGERRAAVFTTEVEGGDAELLLLPPNRGERESLARFTQSANLDEHFRAALIISSDGSIRAMRDRILTESAGKKAPEIGAVMAEKWATVLSNVGTGFEIRMIEDVLAPTAREGMMFLAVSGSQLGNFDVLYDPRSREQIVAGQLAERNGRVNYNVWTSFPSRSARQGAVKPEPAWFSLSNYRINAALDSDLKMTVTTRVRMRVGPHDLRVFPFDISQAMRVTAVKIDGVPAELLFQESVRGRALRSSGNDVFLVATKQPLAANSDHEFEFEHEGDVITSANHVYFVTARATWYPRASESFATYDLTFRYPRRLTLVAAGDSVEDKIDGDWRISRWRTPTPVRLAGFNLGEYEKVSVSAAGFKVDVYGDRRLPPQKSGGLTPHEAVDPAQRSRAPLIPAPPMAPDPSVRLRAVAADVSASLAFYSEHFGPPVLKTLTVAPIPATFGQGFSGLVYLSTLSYMDPGQFPVGLRDSSHQLFFSDLMEAHEVAHQWWGNVVVADAYQDEWMLEALSSYSALLWLEKKKGPKAVEGVLDEYRDHLLQKDGQGGTLESAGPIVWGARLESTGAPDAWRAITYEKGAWIFHMLRRRLGDEKFLKMLAEVRSRYQFRAFSTRDLRSVAKEFFPQRSAAAKSIDTFFENWVEATGIPALKLKYTVSGTAPAVKLSGTLTQTGVDDDFSIEAPVEIQFAKGPAETVWVRTSGEAVTFHATLRRAPAHVALGDVLASRK